MADRRTWIGRRLVAVAVLCGVAGLFGGCCSVTPPLADKYFDRGTPEGTLKGFVYAVDTHQWGYAYESLAESAQEEFGQLRVEVVIRFLKEPQTKIPYYDLISNALEMRAPATYYAGGRFAEITVVSRGRDSSGSLVFFEVSICFLKEEDEWRLDLLRSLGMEPGAPATPAPEEPAAQELSRNSPACRPSHVPRHGSAGADPSILNPGVL